ncbi:MAG: hypothetical protein H6626_02115 [Pseudobdellovibrionaceae bacterium]|nr:MAG: hypothetical protein H6626_02115 [Pseudobdellovibrionaceae bacterium]
MSKIFWSYLAAMVLISSMTLSSAHANNSDALGDKMDTLDLEEDVEEMMSYGEGAAIELEKQETHRLNKDARQKERDIERLRRDRARLVTKSAHLQKRYDKSRSFQKKVAAQAEVEMSKRDKIAKQVEALEANVRQVEEKAVKVKADRDQARKDIKTAERVKTALTKRQKNALRIIKKHEKALRDLNKQRRVLNKRNRELGYRTYELEQKAQQLQNRVQQLQARN